MTIYEHDFSNSGMPMLLHYVSEKYAMLMQKAHGGKITRIEI